MTKYARSNRARPSHTYAVGAGNEGPGISYARWYKVYAVVVTTIDKHEPINCPKNCARGEARIR